MLSPEEERGVPRITQVVANPRLPYIPFFYIEGSSIVLQIHKDMLSFSRIQNYQNYLLPLENM